MKEFTITVPMPPADLHQNRQRKIRDFIRAKQLYRVVVYAVASKHWPRSEPAMRGAVLSLTFVFAIRRRRDAPNHIAAMKVAVDALVAVGVIVDDDWDTLALGAVEQRIEKGVTPYVVMTLTERVEA